MARGSYFTLPSEFSTSIEAVGTATMFYDAVVAAGRKDFFDDTTACTIFAPVDAGIEAGKEGTADVPGHSKAGKRSNKETKGSDEETKGSNGDDKGGNEKKGGNKEAKGGNKETKGSDEDKGSNKIVPDEYIICGFLGYSPQLLPGRSYYTVAGTEIRITWGDDGLKRVNGIPFVQSDIITKNGVLHLIKSVCSLPPAHAMRCDVTNWCAAILILCLKEENRLGRERDIRLFPSFFSFF